MMAKTHIAVGIAASLAVTQPVTLRDYFISVIGGAVGGMICDIDISSGGHYKRDSESGRNIVIRIAAVIMLLDWVFRTGIWQQLLHSDIGMLAVGAIMMTLLCIAGMASPHRGFTHSILALFLFSTALSFIFPPVIAAFSAGFISHLALDMLNKKSMMLFYPLKKGVCLGMCYADGFANRLFFRLGSALVLILTVNCALHLAYMFA